ncbi:TPA: prepilin-type N-terminal cleavage/methylation domain-containing protein [Vibrio parahaemolyticus]|uniref:prepilin-type N-terminal cleavage/methylation domain-containing protein n=1 Tax=Vibrio parahaemolyticus TaxID=670 RepID=UPI0004DF3D3A|nr:prepilin-type N-terminal cleavage/methylation domain-containing protein [Vibrio parahaemolyticus]PWF66253.1 MSHA biogenesis protein MshA [Vibrio sp. T21]EGQ7918034.1 prepilin-type N-terminal cleavage/methylation domain-containing protein [Vibrio parahaemolyticus]EGQ8044958.1 prepilin-type N-terminal cleavage/methylation domain-containing protein [Vibrio parahaemolyticus]EGQ9918476.1 prepilin-type N-terminal cleavage/methylation domain-containing protein [Vibrio parahaemolyticus]EGQ9941676.1
MKRQGGFTLIELVVVIVILGILAVTAAPRFLNLQDDARNSALEGLKGAIAGAAGITYGKAAIAGVESSTDVVSLDLGNGNSISAAFGYPVATEAALEAVVDGLANDWDVLTSSATSITYGFDGYTDNCVIYTQAANANTPAIVDTTTSCGN